MSSRIFCKSCDAETDLRAMVRSVVTDLRTAGLKVEAAVNDAAGVLGLSVATVHTLNWSGACAGRGIDLAAVRARYRDHLRRQVERHRLWAATLERRREDLEREDSSCLPLAKPGRSSLRSAVLMPQ
jgi:hypothetical protein